MEVAGSRLCGSCQSQVHERDVLGSQGEEFARHLEAAWVPTTSTRYEGVIHEFFGASAVLDQAEQAQQQAAEHFMRAFTA